VAAAGENDFHALAVEVEDFALRDREHFVRGKEGDIGVGFAVRFRQDVHHVQAEATLFEEAHGQVGSVDRDACRAQGCISAEAVDVEVGVHRDSRRQGAVAFDDPVEQDLRGLGRIRSVEQQATALAAEDEQRVRRPGKVVLDDKHALGQFGHPEVFSEPDRLRECGRRFLCLSSQRHPGGDKGQAN